MGSSHEKKTTHGVCGLLLFFCGLFITPGAVAQLAATPATAVSIESASPWDLAIIFLGAAEGEPFQQDVEANLREIESIQVQAPHHLQVFVETPSFEKVWDSESRQWHQRPRGIKEKTLFQRPSDLKQFLDGAFRQPQNQRGLVLYSHGLGVEGLKNLPLPLLARTLEAALPLKPLAGNPVAHPSQGPPPPLDFLWLDACFMGNLEAAYELKNLSKYYVSSEEAEFSAGLPFGSWSQLLRKKLNAEAMVLGLAEQFIDSYSYLKGGSQKAAVETSAATISVIETAKLENFVNGISRVVKALTPMPPAFLARLAQKTPRIQMNDPSHVDLGALLIQMKSLAAFAPASLNSALTPLLQELELLPGRRLQTQPRAWIESPTENSRLVYGYDQWTRGDQADTVTLERLPAPLQPTIFVYGPNGKNWPAQRWPEAQRLAPFSVGFRSFHYYFVDINGNSLSSEETLERRRDRYFFQSSKPSSPIRAAGYTQSLGKKSEKYTGVTISDLTRGLPSLNYSDLLMVVKTSWGTF